MSSPNETDLNIEDCEVETPKSDLEIKNVESKEKF